MTSMCPQSMSWTPSQGRSMGKKTVYNRGFFEGLTRASEQSASVVVPLIFGHFNPTRVVDVGCGTGIWLRLFKECGVEEVLGIDGPYVPTDLLQIAPEEFQAADLTKPLRLERSFDMAVCLEVAEHLPPSDADNLVESLTRLAPVIVFSAAIPGQGGTDHLNEQWPDYWAALFRKKHFVPVDCLRDTLWFREDIEVYYAQNTLLFVKEQALASYKGLQEFVSRSLPLSKVHPRAFTRKQEELEVALMLRNHRLPDLLRSIPGALVRSIRFHAGLKPYPALSQKTQNLRRLGKAS